MIDVTKSEFDVMKGVYDVIRVPSVKTSIIVVKALIERVSTHRCRGCDVKYSVCGVSYICFVFMQQYG